MESFAGADLHKRVTQLAVLREGQPPSQFRFANDPKTVDGVLKKLPRGTKIAVEATGSWWWFVEKARELGHEVCLSHPKQTKAIAHARGAGLVASLARPGGNVTGLSIMAPDISGKQLQLLKEAVPKVSRVAILFNPGWPGC